MNTKITHMISALGGRNNVSKILGVSLATVTVWKKSPKVPKFQNETAKKLEELGYDADFWSQDFCKDLRTFVGKDVSLDELVKRRGFDENTYIKFYELKDGRTLYYQVLAD